MPQQDVLRGEVLWEARRRKIEAEFSLAMPLAKGRLDLWTLRKMIVQAIDTGQRLDLREVFSGVV